jgi:two-component system chemotaxis response regulator CheY
MGVNDLFNKLGALVGLPQAAPAGKPKGLILIADDDASLRNVMSRSLTRSGYEVLQAEDGERAVQVYREHRPDLVLLDIYMPRKNGVKVLEELAGEMAGTVFVILTGNEDEEMARTCLKMGAFDYIPKPVDSAVLERLISGYLGKKT